MSTGFRQAICNEIFKDYAFADACKAIRRAGYTGIEIAPFTLAEDPATLPVERRREIRDIIHDEELLFVGLHWLIVSPKGLHVTTPDDTLRRRSWDHILHLIDLCADLGPSGVMVFGSPQQRSTVGGSSREDATKRFVDGLVSAAPHAEERGVTILIEALPTIQTDVITSLDEAARLVQDINSPAVQTMFDTHNAVEETTPHPALIEKYAPVIRHVHVNENDGGHPGTGDYDFTAVFAALSRIGYRGWVSLEAFDFTPGAETIANDSLRYLERRIAEMEKQTQHV